ALAHDLTDPEMYAAVFTEDAELYGAGGRLLAKGREALRAVGVNDRKRFNAGAAEGERSFGALRHVVTNSVIELTSPTTATGFCYVMTIVVRPGGGPEILSLGRDEDEYRKVDAEWLIARREIIMDLGNSERAEATGSFGGRRAAAGGPRRSVTPSARNEKVTQYIAVLPAPLKEICQSLREMILGHFPELREEFKYNYPAYYHERQRICSIGGFKRHANLELDYGAHLRDSRGRVEG